jgi:hypothetical protein
MWVENRPHRREIVRAFGQVHAGVAHHPDTSVISIRIRFDFKRPDISYQIRYIATSCRARLRAQSMYVAHQTTVLLCILRILTLQILLPRLAYLLQLEEQIYN